MKPTLITFYRPGTVLVENGVITWSYPANLITGMDWRRYGRDVGKPSIKSAMRHFANQRGGAMYMMADGSLRVLTKLDDGRISQRTHKPGTWAFEDRAAA